MPYNSKPRGDRYTILSWAEEHMATHEPFDVGDRANPHCLRWEIIPKNTGLNLYLHKTIRSDSPVYHDHPGDNTSWILRNYYIEHTYAENKYRPGHYTETSMMWEQNEFNTRKATELHWIELPPEVPYVISLFQIGPITRDWGFWVKSLNRWVQNDEYRRLGRPI